jgi:hypothetical protein
VNRSVSLPFDTPPSAAGKLCERLPRSMRNILAFSVIQRLLAAAYLRSIDPIALFVQRLARKFGLRQLECSAFEIRIGWRQWFEDKLCTITQARILEGIDVVLGFYADMGHLLPPGSKDELYSRLTNALSEDAVLIAEMAELQKLPIGTTALQRRILALDAGVEQHMATLAHDMVMSDSGFESAISGGVE